ncbi:MAG: hypothetical protein LAO78_10065 [Acidobacteriia bacterium]|nr:hypothetical protein [Terriglobia bacterium]
MTEHKNLDLLAGLCAQIERAWIDCHDRKLVYQLSELHPEWSEELHEFFEDLVLGPAGDSTGEFTNAEEKVSQWLHKFGLELATPATLVTKSSATSTGGHSEAPESPGRNYASEVQEVTRRSEDQPKAKNWIAFLRQMTRQTLPELARHLPNVTTEYLVLVSRHPNVVPIAVKRHIATSVQTVFGVNIHESLAYLSDQPRISRAASRDRPFEKEPETFDEILNRSGFDPDQRSFWIRLLSSNK